MLQSVDLRFPDFLSKSYVIPMIHFYKTFQKPIKGMTFPSFFSNSSRVQTVKLLQETDRSTRLGSRAELVVSQCLADISQKLDQPAVLLFDYVLENYLCYLKEMQRKMKTKEEETLTESSKATMNVNDNEDPPARGEEEKSLGDRQNKNVDETGAPATGANEIGVPCSDTESHRAEKRGSCQETGRRKRQQIKEEGVEECFKQLEEKARLVNPQGVFRSRDDFSDPSFHRGEYDALIISQKYGLIVVETKATRDRSNFPETKETGAMFAASSHEPATKMEHNEGEHEKLLSPSSQSSRVPDQDDPSEKASQQAIAEGKGDDCMQALHRKDDGFTEDLKKTIIKALKQLKQADLVLSYLTSDLDEKPPLTKILALPYVSRARLRVLLLANECLAKAMSQCLQTDSLTHTLSHCLCAEEVEGHLDDMDSAEDDTSRCHGEVLQTWWKRFTSGISTGQLSCETYKALISRFCGKFSRLQGFSVADCIHLTGLYFGKVILRQDQLDLVQSEDNFVCITGPPGSGKTLLLGLKAVEWAKNGDTVVILCMQGVSCGSLVSWLLHQRVKETLCWKKQCLVDEEQSASEQCLDNTAQRIQQQGGLKQRCNKLANSDGSRSSKKSSTKAKLKKKCRCVGQNVHLEKMSLDTKVPEFLQNILQKYSTEKAGVRFIIDETRQPVTEDEQFLTLEKAVRRLRLTKEIYLEVSNHVLQDEDDAKYHEAKEHDRKEEHEHIEQGRDIPPGVDHAKEHNQQKNDERNYDDHRKTAGLQEPQRSHKAKPICESQHLPETKMHRIQSFLKTMEDRLWLILRRLTILKEEATGPALVHTPQWERHMSNISEIRSDMVKLRSQLQRQMLDRPERVLAGAEWIEDKLEMADTHTVMSMGLLYAVYTLLSFFLTDQLGQLLRRMHMAEGKELSVWMSSMYPSYQPADFVLRRLTHCVRCPPAIQEVLSTTAECIDNPPECFYVRKGHDNELPLPSDGPNIKWINHGPHLMTSTEVNDCGECAKALSDYLLNELGIGTGIGSTGNSDGLKLEDVIITGSPIHKQDCCFLQELRERGIDMVIECQELPSPPPYTNKAVVMGGENLKGLEARIVVYVPEIRRIELTEEEQKHLTTTSRPDTENGTQPNEIQQPIDRANDTDHFEAVHIREKDVQHPNIIANSEVDNVCSKGEDACETCPQADFQGLKEKKCSHNNVGNALTKSGSPSDLQVQASSESAYDNGCRDTVEQKEEALEEIKDLHLDTDSDKMHRLGRWNGGYLWYVASRSLSHLIVFYV